MMCMGRPCVAVMATCVESHSSTIILVSQLSKNSDIFAAFRKYKAWAENLTGELVGILRDDKGGEYRGADLDDFLFASSWVLRSV